MPNLKRAALVKARERRVELDRDRRARDGRVEQAAVRVFLGQEQRAVAEQTARDADVAVGNALLELLAERIDMEDVADLCDLEVADVRRLVRLPGVSAATPGPARAPGASAPPTAVATAESSASGTVTHLRRSEPSAQPDGVAGGAADQGDQEAAGAARRAE